MDPAFGGSNPPAPAIPGPRPGRAVAAALLKLAVTAGLLTWLLHRTDLAGIGAALRGARPGWVLAAFALHFVGLAISAVRWQLLLAANGTTVGLPFLARSLLVGTFFNNFLPSTVGGDLMRARDTAAHAGGGTGALAIVLVERASGVLVLGLFALAAPLAGALGRGGAPPAATAAAFALLAGLAAFVALLRPAPLAALRARLARLARPGRGRAAAAALDRALRLVGTLETLAAAPRALGATFLLALALQAAVILHYWCVARSLGLAVGFVELCVVVPVATVLLLVPVSINGIGAREAVFALLLGRLGVTLAEALAFSWIAFGTVLAHGLIGGVVFAARRRG